MTFDRYRADFPWPAEAVDRLRVLYAAHNTYKQCAAVIQAEFGGIVTTGAVAGKVDRARIRVNAAGVKQPARSTGNKGNGRPKIERRAPLMPRKLKPSPDPEPELTELPPDQSPDACTIASLTDERCRWPLGSPAHDMLYCGAPAKRVYCDRHRAIAYRPLWRRG